MPSAKAKAVVEKEENLPVGYMSFEDDEGQGFEEADADSYAIPFLNILQKMSPQVDEADGQYIEGAKPGMLFNTVSEELFNGTDGILVIPAHYRRSFVEWVPRDSGGGGFVAEYDVPTGKSMRTVRENSKDMLDNGNYLLDTRSHYVIVLSKDGPVPCVINMSSTQTKKSKRWMTQMENLRLPKRDGTGMYKPSMFQNVFRLMTTPEKNDNGSWHGWKIAHERFLDQTSSEDQQLYAIAKAFRDAIKSGEAQVQHDNAVPAGAFDDDVAF